MGLGNLLKFQIVGSLSISKLFGTDMGTYVDFQYHGSLSLEKVDRIEQEYTQIIYEILK